MSQQLSEEKGISPFVISLFGNFILFYVFISLFRFFIYDEAILSVEPVVMGMAFIVATFSNAVSWISLLFKMDKKDKKYRYIVFPIGISIVTYLIISFIRYAVSQKSLLSTDLETVFFAVMVGVFEVVGAKIDDVSPRDSKKEPAKPLKYYIDKFIIHATPFHKVMFFVYGFCILFLISIILFALLDM